MGRRVGGAAAVVAAAAALVACPKQHAPDHAATVTCDNVGASLAQELAATSQGSGDPNADAIDRATIAAVVESCTADKWSDAARACFVDARAEAAEKCRTQITDAQFLALEDRMDSAAAKVAPADCAELEPLITTTLGPEIEQAPAAERDALRAKIAAFAAAVGAMCTGGWSVEARTCVRDATRAGADAGRCARWLDDAGRKAYQDAVEAAFGPPPAGAGSAAP